MKRNQIGGSTGSQGKHDSGILRLHLVTDSIDIHCISQWMSGSAFSISIETKSNLQAVNRSHSVPFSFAALKLSSKLSRSFTSASGVATHAGLGLALLLLQLAVPAAVQGAPAATANS